MINSNYEKDPLKETASKEKAQPELSKTDQAVVKAAQGTTEQASQPQKLDVSTRSFTPSSSLDWIPVTKKSRTTAMPVLSPTDVFTFDESVKQLFQDMPSNTLYQYSSFSGHCSVTKVPGAPPKIVGKSEQEDGSINHYELALKEPLTCRNEERNFWVTLAAELNQKPKSVKDSEEDLQDLQKSLDKLIGTSRIHLKKYDPDALKATLLHIFKINPEALLEFVEKCQKSSNESSKKILLHIFSAVGDIAIFAELEAEETSNPKHRSAFQKILSEELPSPLFKSMLQSLKREELPLLTNLYKLGDALANSCEKQEEGFQLRSLMAAHLQFPPSHPLYRMEEVVEEGRAKMPREHLGAQFSHLGTGLLKGGHVAIDSRTTEEGNVLYARFKITDTYRRKELTKNLSWIQENLDVFKKILPKHLQDIAIKEVEVTAKGIKGGIFSDKVGIQSGKGIEINVKGIGRLVIGNDPAYGCYFNHISLEFAPSKTAGESLHHIQSLLSIIGLGQVLGVQTEDDNTRIKIMQLYRAYYPKTAFIMENIKRPYFLPIQDLEKLIIKINPEMATIFDKYLKVMKEEEIYPGKKIWSLPPQFLEELRKTGAWGLMTNLRSTRKDHVFENLACILQGDIGLLSTQERIESGLVTQGSCSLIEVRAGSGDQVFTRMVTREWDNKKMEETFGLVGGGVQVLVNLEVISRGAYAYPSDSSGGYKNRDREQAALRGDPYKNRENLLTFSAKLKSTNNNEVMIKNRIPPEFFSGVIVGSEKDKQVLIEVLRKHGLIGPGDTICGKPIDKFIHVDPPWSESLWQ